MFDLSEMFKQDNHLSELILSRMYPDSSFDDKDREQKALKDINWMLQFIVEAYKSKRKSIVVNLVEWFKELFLGLEIDPSHAELLFYKTKEVLIERYKHQDFVNFMNDIQLNHSKKIIPPQNVLENPYKKDQELYLSHLLNSNKNEAKELINNMVKDGVSIEDIYLFVFQETMRKVGELWQRGVIHVGREHYCTAVTQLIMSSLYEYIITPHHGKKRVLACAIGSELHEIGIRMVADFFEMNGWETSYLGANLPRDQIIQFSLDFKPDIIALSITMPYHLSELKDTIQSIKEIEKLNNVKILVGGIPFINDSDLYLYVGADAVAKNAKEGIEIANKLL